MCAQKEQQRVPRNVQIEINKAMRQKAATRDKPRKLQSCQKGSFRFKQLPQRVIEQQREKPGTAQAASNSGFSQGLEVIVMRVINDFSVIQRFIRRIDNLQAA